MGVLVFWMLAAARGAAAQIGSGAEAAPPLIFNAEMDMKQAHSQNWALAQDHRGVLYVGNGNGLLAFDGARWRYDAADLAPSGRRETTVRALARSPSGRLYLGLVGAFGYVDPGHSNRFVSLSSALPDSLRDFGDVWSAAVLPGAVYFMTDTHLFRVALPHTPAARADLVQAFTPPDARGPDGRPLAIPEQAGFFLGFAARGRFFVQVSGVGLCVMTPDGLRLVPDGERLESAKVFGVVPLGPAAQDGLLVVTGAELLRHDGRTFAPFGDAASGQVVAAGPYTAQIGADGHIVIGTRRQGVFILSTKGALLARVSSDEGLRSDNVTALLTDRDGGLWLALDDGLARIETNATLGAFTERSGLRGGPQALIRMPGVAGRPGRVYAGTGLGLYELEPATEAGAFATFVSIPGIGSAVWSLLPPPDGAPGPLLIGTTDGLYRLTPERTDRVWSLPTQAAFSLLRDPHDPTLLWVGGSSALFGLRERGGRFTVAYQHEIGDSVRSLFADERGRIWAGTGASGLLRLDGAGADVVRYGVEDGLAEDLERLHLAVVRGRPLAVMPDSVLAFDAARDRFVREPDWFGDLSATSIVPARSGAAWVLGGDTEDDHALLFYAQPGAAPDTMLTRLGADLASDLFLEPDGTVWLAGRNALYRARLPQSPLPALTTVLSRASTLSRDSTLYNGSGRPYLSPPLPYADRGIRFAFGATSFDAPGATAYQARMGGLEDTWGRWTDEPQRDYTNLPPGRYTFLVRARDVHGRISAPAAMPFTVLPPWYRTRWAYGLWALLGAGSVAGVVLWQNARRNRREQVLEREVRSRTREVEQQADELSRLNEALARQTAELRRSNEELWEAGELKANLLGMAAHDLQTPLTSVLGFSDILIDEIPPHDEHHDIARRIRDASDEMHALIRDLLNSVAAQTGRLRLTLEYVDLCEVAAQAVRRLEPQAHRKEQQIVLATDGPALADVDVGRMRDAMTNLLSNAVKYAPHGSRIDVRARLEQDRFLFSVSDAGPGLSAEEQERLFRPFERLSPQPTGGEASSGLGLFLVHEIARLHHGAVEVASEPGRGSTFTLVLPADPLVPEPSRLRGAVPAEREQKQ